MLKREFIISNLFPTIVFIALTLLTSCSQRSSNIHLRYGNPSQARKGLENYLIERPQYALSYNCSAGIPNWVSWELDLSWIGNVERSNDFRPDPDLPENCYGSKPYDYRGSGYDRGHLAPSGDRTGSPEDNSATFIMSNIIPQDPANNREIWRELEEYCRDLVFQGKELYIVAGGHESAEKIARNRVTVQKYSWKVVLILDRLRDKVTMDNAETIAVWVPNSKEVANTNWRDYIVPVDQVEKDTGYNFFSRLPQGVQRQIER